LRRIVRF